MTWRFVITLDDKKKRKFYYFYDGKNSRLITTNFLPSTHTSPMTLLSEGESLCSAVCCFCALFVRWMENWINKENYVDFKCSSLLLMQVAMVIKKFFLCCCARLSFKWENVQGFSI